MTWALLLSLMLGIIITTPLDDYVAKPDDHYSWHEMDYTLSGADFNANFTGYVLNMTS